MKKGDLIELTKDFVVIPSGGIKVCLQSKSSYSPFKQYFKNKEIGIFLYKISASRKESTAYIFINGEKTLFVLNDTKNQMRVLK